MTVIASRRTGLLEEALVVTLAQVYRTAPNLVMRALKISAGAGINERPKQTIPQKRPKNSKVTGVARPPYASHMRFNTTRYKLYDHDNPQNITPAPGSFTGDFSKYDHYVLFVKPILNSIGEIPTRGVRIDDLTLSRVLGKMKDLELNARWPADIDMKGMVRARRVPLGRAAKMWVTAGDVDIDGNVMGVEDEGYYYKWWLGLHCLMGHEGFRAGRYLQRPSHEEDLCPGFAFKKRYKAVVQEPEDR